MVPGEFTYFLYRLIVVLVVFGEALRMPDTVALLHHFAVVAAEEFSAYKTD